jgi:hypothetical protein
MFSRKIRTTLAVLAVVVGVTGVMGVGVASADSPTVTIKYNGDGFQGRVKSNKASCVKDRKVNVYKKGNKLYMDTTDSQGRWNTGNSGQAHGKFYAKVAAKPGCAPALSDTITVN